MHEVIIFSHIPKTAGTTFLQYLMKIYGKNQIIRDNSQKPSNPEHKLIPYEIRKTIEKTLYRASNAPTILWGHFLANTYSKFIPDAKTAIIFRDPVERLVSNFLHWKQYPDLKNPICMKMKETNMDIAEFIRIKSLQNLQTQYLNGKELHNFDFIGIRERFDESVKFFCKTFGVNMPIGTIHNKLVQKTDFKADHNIDPFVRDEAEHLNWTDMILYQNAIKQFEKNRERF